MTFLTRVRIVRACHSAAPLTSDSLKVKDPITHYVIVRADLPRGVQSAQLVHAAGESSPGGLASGTHAVVLTAKDEQALVAVRSRLDAAHIPYVAIEEPDAPYDGELMAIGVVPARKEALRKHLSSLPLLR